MKYRIAIASTDGIVVNQHFGHAEKFHIVDIDADALSYSFVETRDVERVCKGHFHHDSSFDKTAKALEDVHAILVAKIGNDASFQLERRGFNVYEAPFMIESVIEKIINDKLWEADKWQFPTKN
ncbi:MAG: dinitrogenase iron-molybdenum cofactor biosynthesis protein [Oscillospiraceae bacterium]|nr:dinitrogenase iron-molybdenum cofactor biosynthesis protein [Oscillospiraceae bacterium]